LRTGSYRLLAAGLLALVWQAVPAQSVMRCGGRIIDVGMTIAEVQRYCGEPASKKVEEQDVRSGNRVVGKTRLSIWTYRQAGSLPRVLEFDQDKLIAIKPAR
jgi:hypothetical protein